MVDRRGGTPATRVLEGAGIPFRLHPYQHSDSQAHFADEAVAALGLDPRRVFKTLLVQTPERELITAVVPAAGQLDLKALATAVGVKKLVMADPRVAERATGMVVGGISPLGQRSRHRCVLDESAYDVETMFCSAGRRGLQLELSPEDLQRLTDAMVARIARD